MRVLKLTALVVLIALSSCKKEALPPNEEELITTVVIELTDNQGVKSTFSFKDLDGEGGNAPSQFDPIVLGLNRTYSGKVKFLNESVSPADDITAEILAEADDHQLYFTPSTSNLAVSILDKDTKNLPLGLNSTWTTTAAATGTLNVTLKHKPGIKAANDPVSKGETDVSLDFQLTIR
jgi:type 1 fimbria pilin